MRIIAFEVRDEEELAFEQISQSTGVEIKLVKGALTKENLSLVDGFDGFSGLAQSLLNKEMLDQLAEKGIKYICTRSIGYDQIDVEYAKSKGIRVCRSYYEPNSVADYTVMLMLMCLRHAKATIQRGNINDHSLKGTQGREMRSLTIGVLGTGQIGATVIENLSGFGAKILAYDKFENPNLKGKVEYVDLDTLLCNSDMITLHTPLFPDTRHLVNGDAIKKMKDGVMIVNTARGELVDTAALIEGLESGKIGGVALDVIAGERGIYHNDWRTRAVCHPDMAYMRQFPNVVLTPHVAFFTDAAIDSMVKVAIGGLIAFSENKSFEFEI